MSANLIELSRLLHSDGSNPSTPAMPLGNNLISGCSSVWLERVIWDSNDSRGMETLPLKQGKNGGDSNKLVWCWYRGKVTI